MDWNWSFRAFRLFGIDVRIHWSLPAFLLYYVVRGAQLGHSLVTFGLFVLLPMLLLFASVLAHEYGHAFAARHYHLPVGHIILTPIGGMVLVAQGRTPRHELVVAAAGPAVNLLLALAAAAAYLLVGAPPTLELLWPAGMGPTFLSLWSEGLWLPLVLLDFAQMQLGLFLFNVFLPAYPMDGGRILMSLFWSKRGFHDALQRSCRIARVVAGALALLGLVLFEAGLMVIAAFVFVQAHNTLGQAHLLPDPGRGWAPTRRPAPKKKKPWFVPAWLAERQERRVRALLAKAETRGLDALTPSERRWLQRHRQSR